MRDIIISTTVCVACLLLALVSQIVAPSTVSAAPVQPAAVRSEASKPQKALSFELDPDDPNPTLFVIADDSAPANPPATVSPLDAPDPTITALGLKITDLVVGSGDPATPRQPAVAHYPGTLEDWQPFVAGS